MDPLPHVCQHGDARIRVYDIEGTRVFPVIGASGGITSVSMIYFCNGNLQEGRDLGRAGLVEHCQPGKACYADPQYTTGFTWAVQVPSDAMQAALKIREELRKFSKFLDERGIK